MKIFFSLILILLAFNSFAQSDDEFPNLIHTVKTNKLERVAGAKVYLQIPKEYRFIKELARYQKSDKLYVQVLDANTGNFNKAKASFTREAMEVKGAKVDVIKNFKLNQFDAVFFDGPSKYPGETKLGIAFGNETFVTMVIGVCETADKDGKKELLEMLKSIYYDEASATDPLELANFEFDHTITNFKYTMTASGMFQYSENGKADAQNSLANSFILLTLPKITEEKAKDFANDMLWRYEKRGLTLDNKTINPTKIGKYPAYALNTKTKINGTPGVMYQVVLVGENSGLLFMGSAYSGDKENLLIKFKKTVESIKIK